MKLSGVDRIATMMATSLVQFMTRYFFIPRPIIIISDLFSFLVARKKQQRNIQTFAKLLASGTSQFR